MKKVEKKNKQGIIYWHGTTEKRQVALTFDDGPFNPYTLEILDILDKQGIKATFFMVGKNVKKFPKIAHKVIKAGHCIGNHTYNHLSQFLSSSSKIALEIKQTEDAIQKATSVLPKIFRPPYGHNSSRLLSQTERLGYITVQWSVNAGDWRGATWQKIEKKVLSEVKNGSIILMHDGISFFSKNNRKSTILALPGIISWFKENKYQLVTVPKLLGFDFNEQKKITNLWD